MQKSVVTGGLLILAAPVLGADGRALGAISVAAPMIRIKEDEFEKRTAPHVVAAAKDFGRALEVAGTVRVVPGHATAGPSAAATVETPRSDRTLKRAAAESPLATRPPRPPARRSQT